MTLVRVESFTVSLDGYGCGPNQTRQTPMGEGAEALHTWLIGTRTFAAMHDPGATSGSTGADDRIAARGFEDIGAWVMGRNMYTYERGDWSDAEWRGWWGDVPPYHCDVYVLTHHPKASIEHGGTTFHFVTEGLETALERAGKAAGGKDIRLGGGTATLREAFGKRLVDEANIAVSHVLLGGGEAVWTGLDLPALGYRLAGTVATETATHLHITR